MSDTYKIRKLRCSDNRQINLLRKDGFTRKTGELVTTDDFKKRGLVKSIMTTNFIAKDGVFQEIEMRHRFTKKDDEGDQAFCDGGTFGNPQYDDSLLRGGFAEILMPRRSMRHDSNFINKRFLSIFGQYKPEDGTECAQPITLKDEQGWIHHNHKLLSAQKSMKIHEDLESRVFDNATVCHDEKNYVTYSHWKFLESYSSKHNLTLSQLPTTFLKISLSKSFKCPIDDLIEIENQIMQGRYIYPNYCRITQSHLDNFTGSYLRNMTPFGDHPKPTYYQYQEMSDSRTESQEEIMGTSLQTTTLKFPELETTYCETIHKVCTHPAFVSIFSVVGWKAIGYLCDKLHSTYYHCNRGKCTRFCGLESLPFYFLVKGAFAARHLHKITEFEKGALEQMAVMAQRTIYTGKHDSEKEYNRALFYNTTLFLTGNEEMCRAVRAVEAAILNNTEGEDWPELNEPIYVDIDSLQQNIYDEAPESDAAL